MVSIPLMRPPRRRTPAEIQRKTPRPLGTNTPAQFASPIYSVQKRDRKTAQPTLCRFAYLFDILCADNGNFRTLITVFWLNILLQQVCEQAQRLVALPEHVLRDGQVKRAVKQHLLASQRHIMCDHTHLLIHACSFECVHAAGNAAVCHIDGRQRIV